MSDPTDIKILYENDHFLAVLKPAGILTQAARGVDSVEVRMKQLLTDRQDDAQPAYMALPHRLDRPVTGVMVISKHRKATKHLGRQFQLRKVEKTYWACVAGQIESDEGEWRDTMRKIPDVPQAELVPPDHPDAKEAQLAYRVLGRYAWGCWLEIQLGTGRMHQIRLQASVRGHPVLGDAQYGSSVAFGPQYDDVRLRPIALHARELTVYDWIERELITLQAPLDSPWFEFGISDLEFGI